jgi:hypothetical protein
VANPFSIRYAGNTSIKAERSIKTEQPQLQKYSVTENSLNSNINSALDLKCWGVFQQNRPSAEVHQFSTDGRKNHKAVCHLKRLTDKYRPEASFQQRI